MRGAGQRPVCTFLAGTLARSASVQDGRAYELQVIEHFPVVSQNVESTGDGEHVVDPAACGLSVETPVHQFQ